MIDPIRRKSVSKPKPYKDIRGKYKWVVYFHDAQKDVRAKKLFVEKFSADDFYQTQALMENKLGAQANNISIEDRRDLLEAKRILEAHDIGFLSAVRNYATLSDELSECGATLAEAVAGFKEWHKTKKQSVSLRRAMEAFLSSKENSDLSTKHINNMTASLERFCESFGGKKIVALITPTEIETWINNLKVRVFADSDVMLNNQTKKIYKETKKPAKITTKNGYRRTLFSFFKFCKMKDWVKENPLEKVPALREKSKTPEIFKVSEIAKMLPLTKPLSDIRAYIAIGAFAGLRSKEIERLTWDKIKLADREIVLDSEVTKTGSRRVVKITENLAQWLAPYSEKLKTHENVIERNFRLRLDKFRETHKIKWVNNGLRHSAATYYLALTKNAYLTAEQMGHAVDVLKQHYNGLAREKEAIAYFDIFPKD